MVQQVICTPNTVTQNKEDFFLIHLVWYPGANVDSDLSFVICLLCYSSMWVTVTSLFIFFFSYQCSCLLRWAVSSARFFTLLELFSKCPSSLQFFKTILGSVGVFFLLTLWIPANLLCLSASQSSVLSLAAHVSGNCTLLCSWELMSHVYISCLKHRLKHSISLYLFPRTVLFLREIQQVEVPTQVFLDTFKQLSLLIHLCHSM